MRSVGAPNNGMTTSFLCSNRSKRSLTINLKHMEGINIIKKLLINADVIVQNFRPGTMKRMGLSYEEVKKIKRKYDFIIIDSPPAITFETLQIIKASNGVFVPVQPSPLDLMATLPFLQIARDERKKPLIILNRVMPRAKLTEAMILRLRYSGAKIARSRISSKVIFAESFAVGRGVVDINVTSDAAKEIINVGNEILRNL